MFSRGIDLFFRHGYKNGLNERNFEYGKKNKSVPAVFERVRIKYAFSCYYVGNAHAPEHQLFIYNERVKEGTRLILDLVFHFHYWINTYKREVEKEKLQ